jgi:hypothetical protein
VLKKMIIMPKIDTMKPVLFSARNPGNTLKIEQNGRSCPGSGNAKKKPGKRRAFFWFKDEGFRAA